MRDLFTYHFMVNAFRAGTAVAVVAAVVGWFMVLREQTYAGHTLSIVGFPGAAAAVWLGASASLGFFAFCIGAALLIAAIPRATGRGYSEESAVIGTLQAFALACGLLFVSLYAGFLNGVTGLLFGSFLGVTDGQVVTLAATTAGCLVVIALIARPLLFASVDADVAAARGIRTRALSVLFLVVLGVAVAEAAQITGALLVFALLVAPAAAAQVVTARPFLGVALSVGFGLVIVWAGLAIAYYSPYPVGFWISAIAVATYGGARVYAPRGEAGLVMATLVAGAAASGLAEMFSHAFMRNAFLAGTAIVAASGLVGYFVVLRSQVFGADALSHVAFTGALAALAIGVDARVGLFGATVLVAIALGLLGNRGRANDVVIGIGFTGILGAGVLFLSIYTRSSSAENGAANVNVLFGSIFGLGRGQALAVAAIGAACCLALLGIARPLLFASLDEAVASARGVPVRTLGIAFLVLVGVCAAEATQAVGALLLVGLIAGPAGAARHLTNRPWVGLGAAAAIALASMWIGLTASYLDGSLPPSFSIMAAVAAFYVLAAGVPTAIARARR